MHLSNTLLQGTQFGYFKMKICQQKLFNSEPLSNFALFVIKLNDI